MEVIQVQLKALGYYNDLIDGQYASSIQNAVTRFQQEQGLNKADTIADESTRQHLQEVLSGKIKCNTSAPVTEKIKTQIQAHPKNDNWWKIISFGFLGSVGEFLYIVQRLADSKPDVESGNLEQPPLNPFTQKKQYFFSNLLLLFHHQFIQQNYYQLNILLWYLLSICLTDQWQIYTVVI
ncbi:peptidoglycan-binding domain-containing protein [Trichormus azollae]|uniref:peptidoglycan-binding domain-containing protein n=1 Tax=Trichormus azollae TaxID=1164 RepID=UPI00325EE8B1